MNDPGGYGSQSFAGAFGLSGGGGGVQGNNRVGMGLSSPTGLMPSMFGGIPRQSSGGPGSPLMGTQGGGGMGMYGINRSSSASQYQSHELMALLAQGANNAIGSAGTQQRLGMLGNSMQGSLDIETAMAFQQQRERHSSNNGGSGLKFDMNDFPALSGGLPDGTDLYGHAYRPDYRLGDHVSSVQQQQSNHSFAMQSDDFPALSGGNGPLRGGAYTLQQHQSGLARGHQVGSSKNISIPQYAGNHVPQGLSQQQRIPQSQQSMKQQQLQNQVMEANKDYSLTGLLRVIRMTDPDLNMLALGNDLTTLGLNLDSSEVLYASFAGPWQEGPATGEPQFQLPQCYYMQPPALKTTHFNKFTLETLFYIFYAMTQDVLQAYAAQELYQREWRFHTDLKLWIKRATSADTIAQPGVQFIFFDHNTWERRGFSGTLPMSVTLSGGLGAGLLPEEEVRVKL